MKIHNRNTHVYSYITYSDKQQKEKGLLEVKCIGPKTILMVQLAPDVRLVCDDCTGILNLKFSFCVTVTENKYNWPDAANCLSLFFLWLLN
jgi:hypothetical protein